MNMQNTNQFEILWNLGYRRLVPIIPPGATISEKSNLFKRIAAGKDDRGKTPGIKWPDDTWSGFDFVNHESSGSDVSRWNAMGAGVGIKTGNGLVLIDADTRNEALAAIIKSTIEARLGILPVRIGQYPKAGYLVRTDADFQYTRIEFGQRDDKGRLLERVEILAEGRQFVAVGIHPGTMQPYRWPDGVPQLDSVPFVSGADLIALLDALRPLLPAASDIVREGADTVVDQASLRGDMDLIRRAVASTPNTSATFPTREAYRDYGYAIKAAAGPEHEAEAFELYADWCARWEDGENPADVVEADWQRMKAPFRRGASWLYEVATANGCDTDFTAATWFSSEAAARANDGPLFGENPVDQKSAAVKKFEFVSFADAADGAMIDKAKPLIKGLLDHGAMTVLYGPSNVGKTFVAMDMAYHVATGRSYAGMKVERGTVIYVAAEGGRGARQRLRAMRDKFGVEGVDFLLLASPVDLRRPDADLRPLIEAVRALGVPVALIVVDTLSRALAGGDENSSVDMGYIVNHFDVLRSVTSAHLMVVHHSGKNAAAGARGHSLLRAATDTEIEVGDGIIEVTKQRDLDKSWSSAFELEVRPLGFDADGDLVTSCTVGLLRHDDAKVEALPPKELEVYEAVMDAYGDTGTPDGGLSLAEINDLLATKQAVNALRHLLRQLENKRHLVKTKRGKWGLEVAVGRPPLQDVMTVCSAFN
jgi:KaiC/GvpD/RAD55 family RecA-like ATPase